ncbi:hypothetical protein ACWGH3_21835 [Streptomyces sp. NPDC054884]|uniref:hypothetical protein n=1 Tax=Streptomyces sp. ME08-AFT2 TaxID=3028683 RepID=UPI0029AB122C|nr:hypothetical protein [Streptomyces sp. ME08-AFT2]MDX3307548.1 hypothetical protein [Streptomyces sp. ME08-AFT2]
MERTFRGVLFALSVALLTVSLSGCGPAQYYLGTGLHDATAAEAAGAWECVDGTRLTLRTDGTAEFRLLDGEGFDFDDAWRVTGTGVWKLVDDSGGQEVHLTMTSRTAVAIRSDATAPTESPAAPSAYTWHFQADRGEHEDLVLFFFYGDPDAGNTYVMQRAGTRAGEYG